MTWLAWRPRRKRGTRLERILAAAALEDAMARAQAPPVPVRAYTKSGRVAHLLGPDGRALCPTMAEWPPEVWLGKGSDEERARAVSLPACRGCEHAAGKAAS